ncbi:unnamed protein product [Caretta caretta]
MIVNIVYAVFPQSYYFDRDDVALRHMAKCLKEQSHEQKEHAELFLTYQNKKAGCIVLQDIGKPEQDEWGNSPEALQCALQLEEAVNQVLVDLLKLATEKNDPHPKSVNVAFAILQSYYFDCDAVALRHMAESLKEQSHEEREHAEKLLKYQNKRGGLIVLQDIKNPERDEWGNSLEALQLEKTLNLDLHKLATEKNDPHVSVVVERVKAVTTCSAALTEVWRGVGFASPSEAALKLGMFMLCDFLESDYLEEQVKAIKQLGDYLTNLKRLEVPQNGMGEYLFDKHTLGESS